MLKPISSAEWNFDKAAHLLNRAGFGGPPAEIEKLAQLGPEAAVASLLDFGKIPDPTARPAWAKLDPEHQRRQQAEKKAREQHRQTLESALPEKKQELLRQFEESRRQAQAQERRTEAERMTELRGWWLNRMARGPRPLQEKLTLFWHGHFATSFQKVRNAYFMWLQNETFRRHAAGSWAALLNEVTRDPAMLIWLDQSQSDKRHPNENFAREVMELFALGEGHYTEKDILEAARALTGLTLDRATQQAVFRPQMHDEGTKTLLGRSGNLAVKDVLEIILQQPQSARFITYKLWRYFASENVSPDGPLIDALAAEFRKAGNVFKPVLRKMFLSEEFYAPDVVRTQIKCPVQWLVGTVRLLETELPPARVSGPLLAGLGQNLFEPPNVKGWDGGIAWISTNSLLDRYNQAALLVLGKATMSPAGSGKKGQTSGRSPGFAGTPVSVDRLLSPEEQHSKDAVLRSLEHRLIQTPLTDKQRLALRAYLDSQGELDADDILQTVRMILCTPEYQLT